MLIQDKNTNILIDAGPDIKNQLIDHNVKSLDAVLITHEHSDHVAGLDELRAFYFQNKQKINLFTHINTGKYLIKRFDYLFNKIIYRKKFRFSFQNAFFKEAVDVQLF